MFQTLKINFPKSVFKKYIKAVPIKAIAAIVLKKITNSILIAFASIRPLLNLLYKKQFDPRLFHLHRLDTPQKPNPRHLGKPRKYT